MSCLFFSAVTSRDSAVHQEGTNTEPETTAAPEGGALTALKYMLLCKIMLNLVCPRRSFMHHRVGFLIPYA